MKESFSRKWNVLRPACEMFEGLNPRPLETCVVLSNASLPAAFSVQQGASLYF